MNKINLIINREYLTRVKNKKFILTTLLTPLGFLLFFVVVGVIFSYESKKNYRVVVSDQSTVELSLPTNTKRFEFSTSNEPLDSLKAKFQRNELDAILVLPKFAGADVKNYTAYYYSDKPLDIEMESRLNKYLATGMRNHKIKILNLNNTELDKLETEITIDPEPISPDVSDKSSYTSKIATVIGGAMGYIIFFIIFLYGAMVMRSVTEEKINRIVEVIISSVKPTELMLGKIIGVGLVGLTQLAIWTVMIPIIFIVGIHIAGFNPEEIKVAADTLPNSNLNQAEEMSMIIHEIGNLNWLKIIFLFVLYFLGGYFVYAALFAAIGAAVGDDINDSQSLTMLITIPIILPIYIMFQAIREPDSALALFASIFPLFSPIVMPALIPFDPPLWQIGLSLLTLILFAYFVVFIAGRIFRTGILMYGKKATIKEIMKWMFAKQ